MECTAHPIVNMSCAQVSDGMKNHMAPKIDECFKRIQLHRRQQNLNPPPTRLPCVFGGIEQEWKSAGALLRVCTGVCVCVCVLG